MIILLYEQGCGSVFVRHVTGNDKDYLRKSPEWFGRNPRLTKGHYRVYCQPILPGETPVWSESSVDERNLYSTRSAIIGLAVETWRVKTEIIIITILHIIIILYCIFNSSFRLRIFYMYRDAGPLLSKARNNAEKTALASKWNTSGVL